MTTRTIEVDDTGRVLILSEKALVVLIRMFKQAQDIENAAISHERTEKAVATRRSLTSCIQMLLVSGLSDEASVYDFDPGNPDSLSLLIHERGGRYQWGINWSDHSQTWSANS